MADTRRTLSALQTLLADQTTGDISAQDVRDELVSNHPANVIQTGAYASEPSSGQLAGDLYLPNDGVYVERYSGSAWVPWGPIWPMTKPVDGDFAWINQGSAAVATTNGGIAFTAPALSASLAVHVRKKSAPSVPYTITVGLAFTAATNKTAYGGLCFRQSSDGKIALFGIGISTDNSVYLASRKMTDATTYSADYTLHSGHGRAPAGTLAWLRIADDNTNRICSFSSDGVNFIPFHTVTRTDFLTANEVGFYMNPYDGQAAMTIFSWKEA